LILIGENLNIMSQTIGPALRARDAGPIRKLAKEESEAGVDRLDLNIGPARKDGPELMAWVVENVQAVTDTPLSLDTVNPQVIEAGLKLCRARPLINSISLQPERLEAELPLVRRYHAQMIGLLWGAEGMPRDAAERGVLVAELLYRASEAGIPEEDIFVDPVLTPVSVDVRQVMACIEFMGMLKEIAPGCQSVVGLSNVSNGTPRELRAYLNRTCLMMLMKQGLQAAIVDAFDSELAAIARGQRPELQALVARMMDGERPALASLSPEEQKYARTVRVFLGETLYSHSWLEA